MGIVFTVCKKVHILVKSAGLQQPGFFVNLCPIAKCGKRHSALLCGGGPCYLAALPALIDGVKILRQWPRYAPEPNPLRLGGRDTFRLPLARKLPFCLRHIAKKLKDNIRYQCTSEISVLMCVQQRHVQDHDSGLLFRCDDTPLL